MQKVTQRHDGCWEWIGKRFSNGYGSITLQSYYKTKYCMAHRVAWELFRGKIPNGLFVLHRCDRPWCVNPEHLFTGTAGDNSRDMISKGRGNSPYGETHPRAKLSDRDVADIRSACTNGASQRIVAERYGVSSKQISVIVNHVQRNGRK